MQFEQITITECGGYICMTEKGVYFGAIFWSRSQAYLAAEICRIGAELYKIYDMIDEVGMPETSDKKPLIFEGSLANSLNDLCCTAATFSINGPGLVRRIRSPKVYYIIYPPSKINQYCLIGWSDQHRIHHTAIFFKKRQGYDLLDSFYWIDSNSKDRLRGTIARAPLNRKSKEDTIVISGGLAGYINGGYIKQQELELSRFEYHQ